MKETCGKTHDGKVVSVVGDKLTTTCGEGKQHCHTMAKDAKVTCDGKDSKVADLKAGGVTRLPLNFWRAQPTYAAIANGASAPYRAFCSRAIRYSWYSSQ